jgi:hypothetical protein
MKQPSREPQRLALLTQLAIGRQALKAALNRPNAGALTSKQAYVPRSITMGFLMRYPAPALLLLEGLVARVFGIRGVAIMGTAQSIVRLFWRR